MRLRAIVLVCILAAFGVATIFRSGVSGYVRPTEAWLEDQIPARLGDFTFIPSEENPKQSYKMDEKNYSILDPIGIVSRIYSNGSEKYDVVVIMGDHADALHDPRICLPGQNWTISGQEVVQVKTKRFGEVPFCVLRTTSPGGGEVRLVVFTFKGPSAFHVDHPSLWIDFLSSEFKHGEVQTGLFLRVSELQSTGDEQKAVRFAAEALDGCRSIAGR
jgi:hypothetical protein